MFYIYWSINEIKNTVNVRNGVRMYKTIGFGDSSYLCTYIKQLQKNNTQIVKTFY